MQTRKEFESFVNLKELNKFLKNNGTIAKMKAERNEFKDYHLVWDFESRNLPEKLSILKVAKPLKEQFYKELRERQIAEFLKD